MAGGPGPRAANDGSTRDGEHPEAWVTMAGTQAVGPNSWMVDPNTETIDPQTETVDPNTGTVNSNTDAVDSEIRRAVSLARCRECAS